MDCVCSLLFCGTFFVSDTPTLVRKRAPSRMLTAAQVPHPVHDLLAEGNWRILQLTRHEGTWLQISRWRLPPDQAILHDLEKDLKRGADDGCLSDTVFVSSCVCFHGGCLIPIFTSSGICLRVLVSGKTSLTLEGLCHKLGTFYFSQARSTNSQNWQLAP